MVPFLFVKRPPALRVRLGGPHSRRAELDAALSVNRDRAVPASTTELIVDGEVISISAEGQTSPSFRMIFREADAASWVMDGCQKCLRLN
jgi:hypothetical protein